VFFKDTQAVILIKKMFPNIRPKLKKPIRYIAVEMFHNIIRK